MHAKITYWHKSEQFSIPIASDPTVTGGKPILPF
jgi:hypothetical protein